MSEVDTHGIVLLLGNQGSGKSALLEAVAKEWSMSRGSAILIRANDELGKGGGGISYGSGEPKLLLVDDLDVVFMVPQRSMSLVKAILEWRGPMVLSMTTPLFLGGSVDLLEPLVNKLSRAYKHYLGTRGAKPVTRRAPTLGTIMRNFKRHENDQEDYIVI